MEVIRGGARTTPRPRPSVATIETFDGFHRTHARLCARLVTAAERLDAVPAVVLLVGSGGGGTKSGERGARLNRLRERIEFLRSAGVQLTLLEPVLRSPFAAEPFGSIVQRLREIGAARLILAAEVEIGATTVRAGELAGRVAASLALPIEVVDPVVVGGRAVTGAAVRAALADGALDLVAEMLGRPYGVGGRVCHGHHRGKAIGVPTANLRLRGFQLPPDGVYAVRARAGGRDLRGVSNLGFNPTFGDSMRSLETHLFDFDADLYGQWLDVWFVRRLRPERKFDGVEALVRQIREDIAASREILGSS